MIKAAYPIKDSNEELKVEMKSPEMDPLSRNNDYRVKCKMIFPQNQIEFYAHGVDQFQATYLGFEHIKREIDKYQSESGKLLEFQFYY